MLCGCSCGLLLCQVRLQAGGAAAAGLWGSGNHPHQRTELSVQVGAQRLRLLRCNVVVIEGVRKLGDASAGGRTLSFTAGTVS